jgi:hypothetical protein
MGKNLMDNLIPIDKISSISEVKRIFRVLNLEKTDKVLTLEMLNYVEDLLQLIPSSLKLEPKNIFGEGVFLRELSVPKNVVVIGHTHKNPHLFILLKGKAKVITPYENIIMKQGDILNAKPLTKKVCITYEDSSFVNIYKNPDNITTESKLIESLVIPRNGGKGEVNELFCSSSSNHSSQRCLLV